MFNIGSNICDKFSLGDPQDAFISGYFINGIPIISARIFSHEGQLLFELANNELTPRSNSFYRRIGFVNGWRICNDDNLDVFTVQTDNGITHLNGDIFNKSGEQICKASPKGLLLIAASFRM